jgi:Cys-tRNA(Pro)/Cys-tRNA(Cys) deacylase
VAAVKSALDVHTTLLERGVPHEIVRLRSRLLTAHDLPRVIGLARGCLAVQCYVVERSAAGTPDVVAVLGRAGTVPSPSALLEALDARVLRAATSDEVSAATDFAAGLVSPVLLPRSVTLLADAAIGGSDVSYCAIGEAGVALGIRTTDLLATTGARLHALTPRSDPGPAEHVSTVLRLDQAAGARRGGASTGRPRGSSRGRSGR